MASGSTTIAGLVPSMLSCSAQSHVFSQEFPSIHQVVVQHESGAVKWMLFPLSAVTSRSIRLRIVSLLHA